MGATGMSSLTATVDPSQARVLLSLDWPEVSSATITRTDPDGRRVPVRDAEPLVTSPAPASVADIEAPLDVAVSYTAADTADATSTLSSAVVLVPANGRIWLKHPGKPDLNLTLVPAETPERRYDLDASVMPAMGRRHPVVVSSGRRQAPASSLSLRTGTLGEATALRELLDDGTPLLLQGPDGFDLGSVWVQPLGLTERWIVRYLPDTHRLWQLEYVTVDRPAGMSMVSIAGSWRYWQALYDSWAEMRVDYTTWRQAQDSA
jgi:hypothetical protein